MTSLPSRRTFLQSAAAAAAGVTIVPRHVLGGTGYQAPSDTFNVAGVGVGGMGRSNLTALASQNIVALCDVDARVLQVACLGMALGTVADDGYFLALDDREVAIFVVVNFH